MLIINEIVFDIIREEHQENLEYEGADEKIFNVIGLRPTSSNYYEVVNVFHLYIFNICNNKKLMNLIFNYNKNQFYQNSYEEEKNNPFIKFREYILENKRRQSLMEKRNIYRKKCASFVTRVEEKMIMRLGERTKTFSIHQYSNDLRNNENDEPTDLNKRKSWHIWHQYFIPRRGTGNDW
uniref:Uncharacterized protein n=1 Tax=Parastrongyloides trichosuri TaxID=131310 RepID=A0A0N4ZI18_PARTI